MRLDDLYDEIFDVVSDVPGLTAPGPGRMRFTPPAPFADLPEITYGEYGPGLDRIGDLPLIIYFGRPNEERIFRDALEYASTSGPRSIPAALAAHTWTSCDTLRCGSAEPTVDRVTDVEMLGYIFHLDVSGRP